MQLLSKSLKQLTNKAILGLWSKWMMIFQINNLFCLYFYLKFMFGVIVHYVKIGQQVLTTYTLGIL